MDADLAATQDTTVVWEVNENGCASPECRYSEHPRTFGDTARPKPTHRSPGEKLHLPTVTLSLLPLLPPQHLQLLMERFPQFGREPTCAWARACTRVDWMEAGLHAAAGEEMYNTYRAMSAVSGRGAEGWGEEGPPRQLRGSTCLDPGRHPWTRDSSGMDAILTPTCAVPGSERPADPGSPRAALSRRPLGY